MNRLCHVLLATIAAILPTLTGRFALAEDRPSSNLAFTCAAGELHFDTGVLKGTLGEGGKSLGLRPVTHIASGVQVAGAFGIFSPYRLLTSDARFGTAAWDWASKSEVLADGAARVHWSPDKDHPLEMTGVYRWAADDTLDLELTVKPQRDLRRFELFLASYFNGFPASLACVRQPASADGSWPIHGSHQGGRRLADVSPRRCGGSDLRRRPLDSSAAPGNVEDDAPPGCSVGFATRREERTDRSPDVAAQRLLRRLDALRRGRASLGLSLALWPRSQGGTRGLGRAPAGDRQGHHRRPGAGTLSGVSLEINTSLFSDCQITAVFRKNHRWRTAGGNGKLRH